MIDRSRSGYLLIAVLGIALLAGCAGPSPSTIQIRDRGVVQPGLRIGANFRGEPEAPANLPAAMGFELGAMRASGEGSQTLAAGQQPIVFGERTFATQQELRHEFDFAYYDFSWRWRHYFEGGPVGFELLGGFAAAELDVAVSSAAQSARESLGNAGVQVGFGLLWRIRPGTTVQARMSVYDGLPSGVDEVRRAELSLVQALGRNVALRAGYADWRVKADDGDSVSDVKLSFSGPVLGLELAF